MREAIVTPDLGDAAAILNLWFVRPGDRLYAGDRVLEIVLGAATVDVSAPCAGKFVERLAWPREALTAGQVVGFIEREE